LPLDWSTYIREKDRTKIEKLRQVIKKNEEGLVKIQENLWKLYPDYTALSINWISNPRIYDWFNRRNNQRFAECIQQGLDKLGFKNLVVFNDSLMFKGLYLKEMLQPRHYIYYIRDYLIVQPYYKKHGVRLEPKIIRTSDAVVTNSLYLQDYGLQFNSKSYYVGQGCEVEMFDVSLVKHQPLDASKMEGPVIGYVGNLVSMRLDIQLIYHIAKQKPAWNIVLVGPEDENFLNSELHTLSNVHFIGRKDPQELPAYVNQFDVCINPQAINQLTIGNYPRKIDEYLAMGKPVVATRTKAMDFFADYTYLASTPEEYIEQIQRALDEETGEHTDQRIAFARSHTWENSVEEIYKVVDELEQKRN
jgi:glycosyltransferase involved in cell wall biosynthesis